MLHPMSMFCCGFQVTTGAYLIMVSHLIACVVYIVATTLDLVFDRWSLTSHQDAPYKIFIAGYCLAGIPVILAAMYGMAKRIETNVRVYYCYLLLVCFFNFVQLLRFFLLMDVCEQASSFWDLRDTEAPMGEAFLCGTLRMSGYFFVACTLAVEVYCLWLIWSWLEDVQFNTYGPELSQLLPSKDDVVQRLARSQDGPYTDIVGLAHEKVPGPHPFAYSFTNSAGPHPVFGDTPLQFASAPSFQKQQQFPLLRNDVRSQQVHSARRGVTFA